MSKKKLFTIPSIGDIKDFEQKKSEVKSHFKVGSSSNNQDDKKAESSSNQSNKPSATTVSATRSTTVKTVPALRGKRNHDPDPESGIVKVNRTESDQETQLSAKIGMAGDSGTAQTSRDEKQGETSRVQKCLSSPDLASTSTNQLPSVVTSVPNPGSSAGPSKLPSVVTSAPNSIIVNPRQRGNPILKHVRNIPWQFGDIVPDYVMGRTVCALYLSLRYHHLNPNYIHDRLKDLGHNFELRVLLVQVDVKDPHHSMKELARMCILADCTLLLAWSAEEAGRYLETYKAYENKPVDALKEKVDQDYLSRMQDCLTTTKSVKKNDVVTLLTTFGTLDKIMAASKEDLSLVPGFGSLKAQRLYNIFHEPFLKSKRSRTQDEEKETS